MPLARLRIMPMDRKQRYALSSREGGAAGLHASLQGINSNTAWGATSYERRPNQTVLWGGSGKARALQKALHDSGQRGDFKLRYYRIPALVAAHPLKVYRGLHGPFRLSRTPSLPLAVAVGALGRSHATAGPG